MSYQLYPDDLTDREWDILKSMIPPVLPEGRPRETNVCLARSRRANRACSREQTASLDRARIPGTFWLFRRTPADTIAHLRRVRRPGASVRSADADGSHLNKGDIAIVTASTRGAGHLWSTAFDRELRRVIDAIRSGELAEAFTVAEDVAKRAVAAGDDYALGRARTFLSEVALLRNDLVAARENGLEAHRILHRIALWGGASRVCRLLADVARVEGNAGEAWQRINEATEAAERVGATGDEGDVRNRALFECHVAAATLLRDENRVDEGMKRLQQADLLAVEQTDPMLIGDLSLVRGRFEWLLDAPRGLELIRKAERIYDRNRLTLRAAAASEAEGDCLLSVGDLNGARDAYARALDRCAETASLDRATRLRAVCDGLDERLRAAQALVENAAADVADDPTSTRSAGAVLITHVLARLVEPSLNFHEFCATLVRAIVCDLGLAEAAAVAQDLGGGSLAILASEPADRAPAELFALLNRGGERGSVVLSEDPRLTIELAASEWAREATGRDFLDLLRKIAALRVTEDVAAELHRGAPIQWPELLKHGMVVASLEMQAVLSQVNKAAQANCNVLITGESGTGKERVARAAHLLSRRGDAPYVVTNCAAMPAELFESKLFGHRKGAFTGATADHPGLFRMATGGTLFLDEIGELPLPLQPKLLRALDVGEIEPIGANAPVKVDVRVIAATNRDLEVEVRDGRFRADLFHRLNVVTIAVPPLRSRPTDILPLARHFAEQICRERDASRTVEIQPGAAALLEAFDWPGNVRQLYNFVLRTLVLNGYRTIREQDVAQWTRKPEDADVRAGGGGGAAGDEQEAHDTSFDALMATSARRILTRALEACADSRSDAAKRLKLTRGRFYRIARQVGLQLDRPE